VAAFIALALARPFLPKIRLTEMSCRQRLRVVCKSADFFNRFVNENFEKKFYLKSKMNKEYKIFFEKSKIFTS